MTDEQNDNSRTRYSLVHYTLVGFPAAVIAIGIGFFLRELYSDLEERLITAQQVIESQESKIAQLSEQRDGLGERLAVIMDQRNQYLRQFQEERGKRGTVEKDYAIAQQQLGGLENQLENANRNLQADQLTIISKNNEIAALTEESESYRSKIEEIGKLLEDANIRADDLTGKITEWKSKYGSLNRAYEQLKGNYSDLEDQNRKLAITVRGLEENIKNFESITESKEALGQKNTEAEGILEIARRQNTELSAELEDLSDKYKELEAAHSGLTENHEKLALAYDQSQRDISGLKEEKAALEREYRGTIAGLEQSSEQDQEKILKYEQRISELSVRIGNLEGLVETSTAKAEELSVEFWDLGRRYQELLDKHASLGEEYKRLEDGYVALAGDHKELKSAYASTKDALVGERAERQRTEEEATRYLQLYQDSQQEIKRLEQELENLIEIYGLDERYKAGENLLKISSVEIAQDSSLWITIKATVETELGYKVNDQRCPDGSSRPFGIYLHKKVNEMEGNFPPQPKSSLPRLSNLDLVFSGDRFNVYLGDLGSFVDIKAMKTC